VTLTYPTLAAARLICVAALGSEKAEIVAAFLSTNARDLPVSKAITGAADAWVLLDGDAASKVSARGAELR
jgi:6-phosphogluconolactonase/glucosamine-6-phosphate isomerase/deaminase